MGYVLNVNAVIKNYREKSTRADYDLVDQISFALPNWIDISSMWSRLIESFVPDFFIGNLGFSINLETSISHSGDIFFDKANILKKKSSNAY